jgi:glycerol uptake facilitator-like aquaporin
VLSLLVLWFGPQIVELFAGVLKRHWIWLVGVIVAGVCVWLVRRLWRQVGEAERE